MNLAMVLSVVVLVFMLGLAAVLALAVNEVWKVYSPRYSSLQVSPTVRHFWSVVLVVIIYSLGIVAVLIMQHLFGW